MSAILSTTAEVCQSYAACAEAYATSMNDEIKQPVYASTLARLSSSIEGVPGSIVDTSCGSGDMLAMYHSQYRSSDRLLLGFDICPEMVAFAEKKLAGAARTHVETGDMRALTTVADDSAAAVISFFAIHHISVEDLRETLTEWHRVLAKGGHLVLAAWEGNGVMDYGGGSSMVARNYSKAELESLLQGAGFAVDRSVVALNEEMGIDAVYIDAVKL